MNSNRVVQNFLILLFAILFALVIGEAAIRLIKPVYDYGDRSLLFSSPTFKQYSGGSIRYIPNEKIREVAVYHGRIEYDVLYSTNNLGLIDTKNYVYESIAGKHYYAFVGDSFTAGVNGGEPWVPKLRDNIVNAEVYNLGVSGTGFEHFYRLLHDVKDNVKITHIVIMAITDDFYRNFWHPYLSEGFINLCSIDSPHLSCQTGPIASIIPIGASEEEVRQISKNKYKEIRAKIDEINGRESFFTKLESVIYDRSAIYYYTKLLLDTYKRTHEPSNIENAIESMRKIRTEFPLAKIYLVHLPQKYEVKTKKYYINIADQISALGITYYPALEKCNWSIDMFFTRDAHPNKYGYENLTRCVSDYLF